jgi:hypothetical protein
MTASKWDNQLVTNRNRKDLSDNENDNDVKEQ